MMKSAQHLAEEILVLPEGRRNDGITRLGGYLRRKGWERPAIEVELLRQNLRRCSPPLPDAEVRTIAASVSRYPPGGPDPLEQAWQATQGGTHYSRYEQFVALICELQRRRPERAVVVPLKRIAALMGCVWESVRGYRQRAVASGLLYKVADPIPHRRASEYRVAITAIPTITTITTIGLVAPSHGGNAQIPHGGNEPTGQGWEQVVRLARRGFRLFPCRPRSKHPQIKSWQHKATSDVTQLGQWFKKFRDCNWACATGEGSGVWALDIDGDAARVAMLRRFREHSSSGAETLCTVTGRHCGYHLFFACPKGASIANQTGIKGWHEDLDVRATGGYVMVPPSIWVDDPVKAKAEGREIRPSRPYRFLQGDSQPIAETLDWLLAAICKRAPRDESSATIQEPDPSMPFVAAVCHGGRPDRPEIYMPKSDLGQPRQCTIHGITTWWTRNDGNGALICDRCHPSPFDESNWRPSPGFARKVATDEAIADGSSELEY